jgi:hypothetical protein
MHSTAGFRTRRIDTYIQGNKNQRRFTTDADRQTERQTDAERQTDRQKVADKETKSAPVYNSGLPGFARRSVLFFVFFCRFDRAWGGPALGVDPTLIQIYEEDYVVSED